MSKTVNIKNGDLKKKILKEKILTACSIGFIFLIPLFSGINYLIMDDGYFIDRWLSAEILLIVATTYALLLAFSYRRCKDIERMWNDLNSVETMKDEFISNLQHELKTPLNLVKGYSELLIEEEMGSINEKQKNSLKIILENSQRLEKRINLFVFLSIASSGDLEYSFDILQLEDILQNVIRKMEHLAQNKGLIIEYKCSKNIPLICGDRAYLIEAFEYILDNAIKFTPAGGNIRVSAYEGHKSIHIKIKDTGIGIPEDKIENVFERFYQADGSKSRKYNGNGLGLYISKIIIEEHKGNIWIESKEGSGSTIHIRLPEGDVGRYIV